MKKNQTSSKVMKILAFSGWSQDKLADLLDVSTIMVNRWARGKAEPTWERAEKVYKLFEELVEPYICELEQKSDEIEKKILQQKIKDLPNDNICPVDIE